MPQLIQDLDDILKGNPWNVREKLEAYKKRLEKGYVPGGEVQRTGQQNRAFHKWLDLIAAELQNQGQTLQDVVKKIEKAEITPTGANLKEVVWRPYQIAALGKQSTTELSKQDIDVVYNGLNKFFGENFEIHIPFPSYETDKDDAPLISDKRYKV